MNKFETSLLQTLSSIDESLKIIASGEAAPKKAPKPAPAKASKPAAAKLPKAANKTAKAPVKAKG